MTDVAKAREGLAFAFQKHRIGHMNDEKLAASVEALIEAHKLAPLLADGNPDDKQWDWPKTSGAPELRQAPQSVPDCAACDGTGLFQGGRVALQTYGCPTCGGTGKAPQSAPDAGKHTAHNMVLSGLKARCPNSMERVS